MGWGPLGRTGRRLQAAGTIGLVALGPVLVLATWAALGPMNAGVTSPGFRLVLLADFVYVLLVAGLVLARVLRLAAARRARSAGSQLHLRLSGVFALMALVPAVSVAIFAGLTINVGLEGWFSDRVRQVVGNSLAAAEAYEAEQERGLAQDAEALAAYIGLARDAVFLMDDGELRQILTAGQVQVQRGLREAFVIDGGGEIRARGERSFLFDFEHPGRAALERAADGETVIIQDWTHNEFRALLRLPGFPDRFLYVSRDVDGQILQLLDETQETIRLYNQLERERGRILFEFGLLYLGFALILILAAVWLGLWFAERLSRPVGRLAGAAERVGRGDLDVQVPPERGEDEIATLGRVFNQMTRQLKGQREALLENTRQIEARRRLFDSVLSSVSPGVIGLDAEGRIEFVNPSARRLLELDAEATHGRLLSEAVPEFAALLAQLHAGGALAAQEELRISRGGRLETLLVRLATRTGEGGGAREGYVVAFDDVTDLVSAQRLAAWGDVARRIAHEIKNPLTPIQLSAERIRRKFRPLVGDQAETLDSYTEVIVRQTGDLRRIVDEFSRFARMPEPDRRSTDLVALVRDAVTLQQAGQPGVAITADLPDAALVLELDATMLGQALTNLIKNAGEAIETLAERGAPEGHTPEIRVALRRDAEAVHIAISDNGIGLPEDRARLFEPYVTTRAQGTGLGLPIVKKIIEEHGGTLRLNDAEAFGAGPHRGARAEIRLPLLTAGSHRKRPQPQDGRQAHG
ncbi:sensor histidine kinase NtrY-like [Rhodobaculum claviforme]|uniref:histidine kinase n=1 Tax=Rhodobaculum claviforme TaxID=1549854 RepID=A0A934TKV0_9RHOB|nr:PAS domain-containing sensor histidine kinase [Rhodobaculum claviforme]MBK5927640.1 PAS domain-containing sensor histidine kinase [Rhodobaculum claviforme]